MGRFSQSCTERTSGRWPGRRSSFLHPYWCSTSPCQDGKLLPKLLSATLPNKSLWLRRIFCLTDISARQRNPGTTEVPIRKIDQTKNPNLVVVKPQSGRTMEEGSPNLVVVVKPQSATTREKRNPNLVVVVK